MTNLEKRIDAWLERWLGWTLPAGVGWLHTLGAGVMTIVGAQLVTGALLALYYCPSPDAAWESIRFIEQRVHSGALVRGLHSWGASAMVLLLGLHVARVFAWGAFKAPRRLTWLTGCALLFVTLGLGFTGYLLPWDARGYYATRVAAEIAGNAPVAGPAARQLLLGGTDLGPLTLTRFYAVHVILLPAALLALIALHLWLVRRHGTAALREGETTRFYPDHAWKDSVVSLGLVLLLLALAWLQPAELAVRAKDAPADYVPRPEWYFLPLYELLHFFPGPWIVVGAYIIPGLAGLLFIAWPWLETGPDRLPSRRRVPLAIGTAGAAVVAGLFLLALFEPPPEKTPQLVAAPAPKAAPGPAPGSVEAGKKLYGELDCALCHDAGSGPDLGYEGSKVRHAWLVDYLLAPYRIRWKQQNVRPLPRMPDFKLSTQEAEALAAFLMTKRNPARIPGEPERKDPSSLIEEGGRLVEQEGCLDCHVLGSKGKPFGPELTAAGARLQRGYIRAVLTNPAKTPPGNPMKDLKLTAGQIEALVAYLATLRG